MWQQGFNNKITQTNSGLAGGIPGLGESPHPLPVLHAEKALRLTARGVQIGPVRLAWTRLLGIYQGVEMLKIQLCSGSDSGVIWSDSGGLLPQREHAEKRK